LALRGTQYKKLAPVERVVLYEKYNQERMAEVNKLAAIVLAGKDIAKAGEFLTKYMDCIFPEAKQTKELTLEQKVKQLNDFSNQEVALVHGAHGLELSLSKKEKSK
jgi:hypothetical protein